MWELLDLHTAAEEAVFYPELVQRGSSAEDETLDAVGDHNEIRDAVHDAARHPVGSTAWYQAAWTALDAEAKERLTPHLGARQTRADRHRGGR